MKKIFLVAAMFCFTASYAQVGDGGRKASKKNQKMMERSTDMQNASKADDGARGAKDLRKMEKKEARINKKAEKIK